MQPQPNSQPIAGLFVPRLVARLHREGFDGSLRLHSGGATRVVYFRRGDIASAASNADDDRLPSILIREGRLTGPQVEMAKQKQRPGVSLGKSLIELGFLTPSELLAGARRQVRQILAACFALADGTWQTIGGPLGPEVTNLGLPTRRLIFDALMESGDRGAIVREMGSMESIYRPAAGLDAALPVLRLEASMEEVARMTDGRATLREVSGRTRLDDFTVSRIVLGLDILGLVELASRPEPAASPRPSSRLIRVEGPEETPASFTPDSGTPDSGTPDSGTPEPRWSEPAGSESAGPESTGSESAGSESVEARDGGGEAEPETWRAAVAPAPGAPAFTIEDDGEDLSPAPAPTPYLPPAAPIVAASAPDDNEAEPPPFPPDELPAFARTGAPSPSGWTEDPATGERVHAGPIELTFDGPVGPGGAPSTTARRVAIGAVLVVLVLGGGAAFLVRRGGDSDRTTAERAPVQVATAEPAAIAKPAPSAAAQEAPPPAATGQAPMPAPPDNVETGGEGRPSTAVAQDEARAATPGAAPDRPIEVPAPRATPPAEAPAPASPGPSAVLTAGTFDFTAGHALLDAGDLGGAEAAFARTLRSAPGGSVTLQILIACDPATIGKARAATGPGGDLFALPVAVKERACHRLLWGIYPDPETARSAVPRLPTYFVTSGVNPVPVAVARLGTSR